ncbi:MAG: tripartite tricarboxylate transporter substrate binding protein [Lachnospiraceae bacterium]|nr:tripartite tricarboxylate transporter substrate binding protein [Lachnospiraceae bacterium]
MKKKSLALLMAAAMVLGLAGCGAKEEAAAPAETPKTEAPAEKTEAPAAPAANADGFYAGKTVEMIVPWGAGGGADVACRLICAEMEKELGCTIVINNVTGGGGSIGLAQLAEANADGMTYAYFANTDSNGDIMLQGVPYNKDSFAPVCKFAADPHIILASNASGITDLKGLIDAGDGKTLWGIGGAWTHWDFLKLEFQDATGASYKRMVYDGGASVITDIMNGDCTVGTPFVSEALAAIDAGEAVAIAITSAERIDACPDIPTVAELGYEGFESTMWRGFVAPAGTPEDAMREFADAAGAVCAKAEFVAAAAEAGVTVDYTGFDDFQTFYAENHESVKAYFEANKDM